MATVSLDSLKLSKVYVLRRGQTLVLDCFPPISSVRNITLQPGEFIIVSCDLSPVRVIVACQNFRRFRGFRHLESHQRLIVHC